MNAPSDTAMKHERPSWDDYFVSLVREISKRATCDRGRSGCLIVKEKRIVCTGYVGSPPGMEHCDEAGHLLKRVMDEEGGVKMHCVRTIHAEQNALCQAAKYGIGLDGATLYCSMEPCRTCAMLIASVGISRVVAMKRYHAGQDTRGIFEQAGIELDIVDNSFETYEQQ